MQFSAGSANTTLNISVVGAAITAAENFVVTVSDANGNQLVQENGVIARNYTPATLPAGFTIPGTSDPPAPTPVTPSEADVIRVNATTVGVARFLDTRNGTHFFTGGSSEASSVRANLSYFQSEGVGFDAVDPQVAGTDPAATPVYRFLNTGDGTHFYTANATEEASVIASRPDLVFEGIGFYEHTRAQPGDIPVYRFLDQNNGSHFYTPDATERASILATRSDLKEEGIAFYAPSTTFG